MKNTKAFALSAVVGLSLASCTQGNVQTSKTPADLFDPGTSVEARTKISDLFAGIPESEKAGIDRFEIVYVDDDGQVYSNRTGLGTREGKIVEQGGSRIVRFSDGDVMPAPSKDTFNPSKLSANASTYGTCNTSDGPYFRSYTKAGYAGIRGNLTFQTLSAIGKANNFNIAAYAYFGGQAANGASTSEGGLVYYAGSMRIFFTAPGNTFVNTGNDLTKPTYQEFKFAAGAPSPLTVGTSYPVRYQIFANGTNSITPNGLVWVDVTVGGITTAKIIRFASTQMNVAGTDQYLKRMATIASTGFVPYNGTTKYASKNQVLLDQVNVGTWNGNGYNWTPWTSSSAFSANSDCKWPTAAIVTTSPANTAGSASVTAVVDMSK
jgi:hypothetical protein